MVQRTLCIIIFTSLLFASCATGIPLATRETVAIDETVTVTLFLYGCHHGDDLENLAFMVREPARYSFSFFAREKAYRVKKGVPAAQALREAEKFLNCTIHFETVQLSVIEGSDGSTAGYEVRPLYSPTEFGRYDILDVRYSLKGDAVTVYIQLDRDIEQRNTPFIGPHFGISP